MSAPRVPDDPVRFIVGVVFAATLSTVLVGLMSTPGLYWVSGLGGTAARVAAAVVVGYGIVLTWQLGQHEDEGNDMSGLQMVGRFLLAMSLYSGIVAAAAVVLPALGSLVGLSTDAVVYIGLFYPWWEEFTTAEALPLPVPLSVTGLSVYVLVLLMLVSLVVQSQDSSSDADEDAEPNVRRGSEQVAISRQWPTVFVNRDRLFGQSSSR